MTSYPNNFNKSATLLDVLAYRASKQSNDILYRFLNDDAEVITTLSASALKQQALAQAATLLDYAAPGDRALIACSDGDHFITLFFACLYAGIIAVPSIPPRRHNKAQRTLSILNNCQPKLILTEAKHLSSALKLCKTSGFKNIQALAIDTLNYSSATPTNHFHVSAESIALLQYSSGTTGSPKGVVINHRNIMTNLEQFNKAIDIGATTHGLSWLPPYHDMGLIGGVLQALYAGSTLTFMSATRFARNPFSWLKAISDYQIAVSGGPNFAYDMCINHINKSDLLDLDLSRWRIANIGAEMIQAATIEKFSSKFLSCGFSRDAFFPSYGLAEATLFISGKNKHEVCINKFKADKLKHHYVSVADKETNTSAHDVLELVSSGKLGEDIQIKIVQSQSTKICAPNEVGEICIKGGNTSLSYWGQKELSKKQLHVFLNNNGPYMRTGDLGFLYEKELYIFGRSTDLIILNRCYYNPQIIQFEIAKSHPDLPNNGTAVFSVNIDNTSKLIIAQEIKLKNRNLALQPAINNILKTLANIFNLKPFEIIFIQPKQLPRTSSGKIQHYLCKERYIENRMKHICLEA